MIFDQERPLDCSQGTMVTVNLHGVDEVIVTTCDGSLDELHTPQSLIAGGFRRGQWPEESPLGTQKLGKKFE